MNSRRSRNGRNGGKRSYGSGQNRSYESNGPDVKVRGTANQVFDKYVALARDANAAGDRIAAEGYYQHAEHYFRVYTGALEANQARQAQAQAQNPQNPDNGREDGQSQQNNNASNNNPSNNGPNGGNGADHAEQVTAAVATESTDIRETELSETDVARSEPN